MLLIISVLALFGKVFLSGDALFGSDFLLQFYPWKNFLYETVRTDGSIPFWNPYLFSGTPFIANIQASMFYPLGFLYYLLPTDVAYLYSTVLHCILGAVFMYAFMRSLNCFRTGAFLSGFVFVFNGYFMSHLYAGHLSFVQNYIWIPLIFLFVTKFMRSARLKDVVWAGLFLGIQILGGFPQIAFYTLLAILLLGFYFTWLNRKENGLTGSFRALAGTAFLILIGFSIAAIQLFPTYEFTQLSTRAGGVGYEFATMDSLPPKNLLTFFFPLLFGSPVDGTYWVNGNNWEFWEYCGYLGMVTMVIIVLAMGKLWRDPMGLFFIFLALVALFLSFGKYNPLYPFIYLLPGFDSFRIPAQILFLYVFSLSVLCGKALELLQDFNMLTKRAIHIALTVLFVFLPPVIWLGGFPESVCHFMAGYGGIDNMGMERLFRIVSTAGHGLLMGCCYFFGVSMVLYLGEKGSIKRGMFIGLLVGLSMMDLTSFAFPLIRTFNLKGLLNEGRSLSHITENRKISRSLIIGDRCFINNAGLWYGFQDIQGYDPLILRRYVEYVNRSQNLPPNNKVVNLHYIRNSHNRLIRMLNLEYVVSCRNRKIETVLPLIPRCSLVHRMETKEMDEILDYMMQKSFDPLQMVVFEPGHVPENFSFSKPGVNAKETCRITRYENDEIRLISTLDTPGFLVMSEIQYPGWQAWVDGERVKILRGNYLFRVLPLSKGCHEIQFVFRPVSFKIGVCISFAAFLGVMVLGFRLQGEKKNLQTKNRQEVSFIPFDCTETDPKWAVKIEQPHKHQNEQS